MLAFAMRPVAVAPVRQARLGFQNVTTRVYADDMSHAAAAAATCTKYTCIYPESAWQEYCDLVCRLVGTAVLLVIFRQPG
jgi:hypothetical protein